MCVTHIKWNYQVLQHAPLHAVATQFCTHTHSHTHTPSPLACCRPRSYSRSSSRASYTSKDSITSKVLSSSCNSRTISLALFSTMWVMGMCNTVAAKNNMFSRRNRCFLRRLVWYITHATPLEKCDMTRSWCGTWLIQMWHDLFMGVTWLVHMWDMTHSNVRHDSFTCETWLIHMYDVTHSSVGHDSFKCDMTRSCVGLDLFTCGTWLIHMWDMTHWLVHMWDMTHWLVHMWDMTHLYVKLDSSTCRTWLIYVCGTWLIHRWDLTYS